MILLPFCSAVSTLAARYLTRLTVRPPSGLHGRIPGKRRRTNHGWSKKKRTTTRVANYNKLPLSLFSGRVFRKWFPRRAPPPPRKGPRRSPRTPVPRKRWDYV